MAKRLVTYIVENEKNKVLSISAPIGESDINVDEYLSNGYGIIDADFETPIVPKDKKLVMYYNDETKMIEFEISDLSFEDLSGVEQVKILKEKVDTLTNANNELQEINQNLTTELEEVKSNSENLKSELELTQLALFDVVEATLS